MVARGRRAGYLNYSVREQMLICTLADRFKPIGRNMWEALAVEYNAQRARRWMARDFDSLRRKFRSLYSKPKLSGVYSDLPPKLQVIHYAQEIQVAIDIKGGVTTSHDGRDRGEDDLQLLQDIDDALGNDSASEDGDEPDTQRESDEEDDDSADLEEQGVINRRSPLLRDVRKIAKTRRPRCVSLERQSFRQ
ncbi:hypothetical protein PF005_g16833 [Phytophthora fragariae]|uniref:DUF6818 domain-containing protein n=2 Tax=Phytophthora fragariae TaxID=53985 RepID=A0A6A3JJR8_9STRA|nr:hypothetical protein PF011_g16355 [Phytophthora fragariae]KAE9196542.1 hypothetical protein PF005_g16833 [Phytophthora fragariae]